MKMLNNILKLIPIASKDDSHIRTFVYTNYDKHTQKIHKDNSWKDTHSSWWRCLGRPLIANANDDAVEGGFDDDDDGVP